ncbi:MAG: Inositol 2-dehydrogenase [Verrucomicrobiota bacterium]|jgi:predicted dehydrogenase
MHPEISRRHLVGSSLSAGAALAFLSRESLRAAAAPANKIVLGVAGIHGRGLELINKFGSIPGVEFKYVIDVDKRYLAKAVDVTTKAQGKAPQTENDFRRVLEDQDVDALIIAAPDHWHAPMATLAAKAGKHV